MIGKPALLAAVLALGATGSAHAQYANLDLAGMNAAWNAAFDAQMSQAASQMMAANLARGPVVGIDGAWPPSQPGVGLTSGYAVQPAPTAWPQDPSQGFVYPQAMPQAAPQGWPGVAPQAPAAPYGALRLRPYVSGPLSSGAWRRPDLGYLGASGRR